MLWEYQPPESEDTVVQAVVCPWTECAPQAGLSITSARQVRFANGSWTRKYKVKMKGGKYRRVPHFRFRVNLRASGNTVVEQVGYRFRFARGKWSRLGRPSGRTALCQVACLLPSHSAQQDFNLARPPKKKDSYLFRVRFSSSNTKAVARAVKVRPSGVR